MPLIEEVDIWRSASEMIKLHGEDAAVRAAMRADALLERGDLDGAAIWKRVVRAIGELTLTAPPSESARH